MTGTKEDASGVKSGRRTDLLALFLLAAAVLLFHRQALTYHFWPDDWRFVGPPTAAEFLADPSSLILGFPVYDHYNPLQKAWFVAQSLLFQDLPLPYHVLNLPLAVLAAFALFRLLVKYGIPHTAALCGALYFVIAPTNMFVISWITGSRYLWLVVLLVLALSRWEDFLGTGGKKHLWTASVFTLAAQFVHSIGVVFPLILGARAILHPPREGGPGRGRAAGWALLLTLAAGFLQVLPRFLLSEVGYRLEPNLSLLSLAQAIGKSLAGQAREAVWLGPLGPLVLVLFLPLLAAWAVRREHWRVMALGVILAVLTLVPPVVMIGFEASKIATRMRYLTLPHLGIAFVFAGLISAAWPVKRAKAPATVLLVLAGAFMAAVMAQTKVRSAILHEMIRTEDQYVWKCAEGYRRAILSLGRAEGCRRILITDVFLDQPLPRGVIGNLLIQDTNHETFHRFFRLSERTGLAVKFLPPNTLPNLTPGDCLFLAFADELKRF